MKQPSNTHLIAAVLPATFGGLGANVSKITFPKHGPDKYLGNALMKALPESERDRLKATRASRAIKGRALVIRRDP